MIIKPSVIFFILSTFFVLARASTKKVLNIKKITLGFMIISAIHLNIELNKDITVNSTRILQLDILYFQQLLIDNVDFIHSSNEKIALSIVKRKSVSFFTNSARSINSCLVLLSSILDMALYI